MQVCPARLMPAELVRYARASAYEYCRKSSIMDCSGCAACVYVCPARIPLLKYINTARRELNQPCSIS